MGGGPGIESRAAIGWVVFGGLGSAALLTLLLTPALYVLIAPLVQARNGRARKGEQEFEAAGELAQSADSGR